MKSSKKLGLVVVLATILIGLASCSGNSPNAKAIKEYESAVVQFENACKKGDVPEYLKWAATIMQAREKIDEDALNEKEKTKIKTLEERFETASEKMIKK